MSDVLTADQEATWLAYRRMHTLLMAGLDRQLSRYSGMPQGYYTVLAQLAAQPDRRLLLADLARRCHFSQSRVSHAVARMEKLGWMVRESADTARPSSYARLTDAGVDVQAEAAVGHDRAVRDLFFSGLTGVQARELGVLATRVGEHVEQQSAG